MGVSYKLVFVNCNVCHDSFFFFLSSKFAHMSKRLNVCLFAQVTQFCLEIQLTTLSTKTFSQPQIKTTKKPQQ